MENRQIQIEQDREREVSMNFMANSMNQAQLDDTINNLYPFKKEKSHQDEQISTYSRQNSNISEPHQSKIDFISLSQFPTVKGPISTLKTESILERISDPSEIQYGNQRSIPSSKVIITSSKYIGDKEAYHYSEDKGNEFTSKRDLEISEIFQFRNMQPQDLLEHFVEFSGSKRMKIQTNEADKVIVKGLYSADKQLEDSTLSKLKQIFHFCLPGSEKQYEVYQLKIYLNQMKAKIVLCNGKQENFQRFKDLFLANLWNNHKLSCKISDQIQFFFVINQQIFQNLCFKIDSFSMNEKQKKVIGLETGQNQKLKQIISECKEKQQSIKKMMSIKIKAITPSVERLIVGKFYQHFDLLKMVENYVTPGMIRIFNTKKQRIRETYSVRQIFVHLNLNDLYQNISKSHKEDRKNGQGFRSSLSEIPFLKSISVLQSFEFDKHYSPYACFDLVASYLSEMHQSYNEYYKNTVKLNAQIEDLQLGIYCILMSENKELWQNMRLLRQFWNNNLLGYKKELECLTTLEKGIFYLLESWNQV